MSLHAGHCSNCDVEIFQFVAHGRTGERVMLYPKPDSVYARIRNGESLTPGVGYCATHVPPLGPDVLGLDSAAFRYAHWFTRAFGQHLRAWVADHLELPEHEQEAVMAQWAADCRAVEGVHA